MYGVLIVDDEPMIRKRLRHMIQWEEFGMGILGEAADGEEALLMARTLKPDIIFTDIRMPVIDGLSLIRNLSSEGISPRIVILSGYSDFKFAHEAMQYGIRYYLLKPVNKLQLISVLGSLQKEIRAGQELNSRIREGEQALKERFASELIHCRSSYDSLLRQAEALGMRLDEIRMEILAIRIDRYEDLIDREEDEILLKRSAIRDAVLKKAGPEGILVEEGSDLMILLLLANHDSRKPSDLRSLAEEIRKQVEKTTGLTVSIGFGDPAVGAMGVSDCYKEAIEALEGKFLLGGNRSIHIREIYREKNQQDEQGWEAFFGWDRGVLIEAVERNDREEIGRQIDSLFEIILSEQVKPVLVKGMITENIMGIIRAIRKLEGDVGRVLENNDPIGSKLGRYRTLDDWKTALAEFCMEAGDYCARLRKSRPRKLTESVLEYIERHYPEDITLKSIAGIVYINPVYLGQVFKNDVGKSFNEHLTEIRINHAGRLLLETQTPISEIAVRVGYQTQGNFNKAFKRLKGCSPADYRGRSPKKVS